MSDEVAAAAWPGSALRVFTGKETFQYGFSSISAPTSDEFLV